jgi:hypothetical protein
MAKELGERYEPTLKMRDAGIDLETYLEFKQDLRLTRAQFIEAYLANPDFYYYANAREFGLSHVQAVALIPFTASPNWEIGDDFAPWVLAGDAVRLCPEGAELIATLAAEGFPGNGKDLAEVARRLAG